MLKGTNFAASAVTVTTTATKLADSVHGKTREAFIVHNQGAVDAKMYIDAVPAAYIVVKSGETMHFPNPPTNEIYGITDSGSTTLTIMVG